MIKDKKSILIVDDDPAVLTIMKDELTSEGFEVDTAKDGRAGLQKTLQGNPDLVILDLMMPFMDGLEVLREIRADERCKDTAVMLLTQVGDKDKIAKAVELGVAGYLIKADYSTPEIIAKVKDLLG